MSEDVPFFHLQELVSEGAGAREDVHPTGGHLANHPAAIEGPVHPGRQSIDKRIRPPVPDPDDDVGSVRSQLAVHLADELRGLLQVRGHHGEPTARPLRETGTDRCERAEVPGEKHESCRIWLLRKGGAEKLPGPVRAPVDHEHRLEAIRDHRGDLCDSRQEMRDVRLVPVHGDDE